MERHWILMCKILKPEPTLYLSKDEIYQILVPLFFVPEPCACLIIPSIRFHEIFDVPSKFIPTPRPSFCINQSYSPWPSLFLLSFSSFSLRFSAIVKDVPLCASIPSTFLLSSIAVILHFYGLFDWTILLTSLLALKSKVSASIDKNSLFDNVCSLNIPGG